MALTYSMAFGIVSDVFGKVHKATGLHIKYDDETTDGHLYAGLYQFTNDYISDPDVSKALRRDLPVKLGSGEAFWIGVPHAHMLKFLSHFVDKGFVQCDDFVFVRFYELSGKFHVLRLEENVQALMNICRSEHKCLK